MKKVVIAIAAILVLPATAFSQTFTQDVGVEVTVQQWVELNIVSPPNPIMVDVNGLNPASSNFGSAEVAVISATANGPYSVSFAGLEPQFTNSVSTRSYFTAQEPGGEKIGYKILVKRDQTVPGNASADVVVGEDATGNAVPILIEVDPNSPAVDAIVDATTDTYTLAANAGQEYFFEVGVQTRSEWTEDNTFAPAGVYTGTIRMIATAITP